jgi:hypothetical protein
MGWLLCATLAACAQAEPPAPVTALPVVMTARAPAMPAIDDAEPDVARQVSEMLGRIGQGTVAQDQLTDNARAALTAESMQAMSAALRPCGAAPALELLRRTTKGEDRQYLYRVKCGTTPQLVEIDFNKGARVNRLIVRAEPR